MNKRENKIGKNWTPRKIRKQLEKQGRLEIMETKKKVRKAERKGIEE